MKIDYKKDLNPGQYEAAIQKEGVFLVIAGAGSGKTRTLVYRVAHLVDSGVAPEGILLLTFTRKASTEMLFRSSRLLDDRCSRVSGGTFHSVGNALLRRYGEAIGLDPDFTILDTADARDCVNVVKDEQGLSGKHKNFPKKSTLMAILSLSVNKSESIQAILTRFYPQFLAFMDEIQGLKRGYAGFKKKHNLVDYDDLLVLFKELLKLNAVRERVQARYQYLMVDEFQDTNILQGEIINLLGRNSNNVMAVGDPAQCIYSFRGANFRNIREFERSFPTVRVIKLEENYRSTQKILNACNAIMRPAREKFSKRLFTRSREGEELACLVENSNPVEEARFIADKAEEISIAASIPLNEIAVLFRNSYHAFILELELNKRKIPFVKFGGFKFMETAHIKDVVAHLRVIKNPRDTISWNRMLLLLEGMGAKTAMKVVRQAQAADDPFAFSTFTGFEKFRRPFQGLEALFSSLTKQKKSPSQILARLLDYYFPIMERKYDDHPKRKKDLEQFLSMTDKYQRLEQLLTDISLDPPNTARNGNLMDPKSAEGEHLVLSTVHSAKGLEWNTVFVIAANEGSFPSPYSVESEEDLEEERRLFYVAATRAKERLFFTFASKKKDRTGSFYFVSPSQFLSPLRGNGVAQEVRGDNIFDCDFFG